LNYQVKRDEMGRACSTKGENRNAYRKDIVGKGERKETTRKTKTYVCGKILKWILERWDGVDWIDLAQDRDQ
jgi:hypothetical protein